MSPARSTSLITPLSHFCLTVAVASSTMKSGAITLHVGE